MNQINIPAGIQYDDTIKLNLSNKIKKNMKINIVSPDSISEEEREIFEKLREINLRKF